MLCNIRSLYDAAVLATDGEVGRIRQFFFDDEKWVVRYLVVNTGSFLHRRQVLISPLSVSKIDWANQLVILSMTKQQVQDSPDIDADMPISRQHEIEFHTYFGWSTYWGLPDLWAAGPYPIPVPLAPIPEEPHRSRTLSKQRRMAGNFRGPPSPAEDSSARHLRSTREVIGYKIHAMDSEFGHLEDFILDDETWALRYLVIDMKNWWSSRLVLISSHWIKHVSWDTQEVITDLSQDVIKNSPEYNPESPVSRDYERRLHNYYDIMNYWENKQPRAHRA